MNRNHTVHLQKEFIMKRRFRTQTMATIAGILVALFFIANTIAILVNQFA